MYILEHIRQLNEIDEMKFIGVYSAFSDAKDAIQRMANKPGFKEYRDGFVIFKLNTDNDNWQEGFISIQRNKDLPGKKIISDIPAWAENEDLVIGESGNQFAKRLCDTKYGINNYYEGSHSEFYHLKAYGAQE
jgi:homoserine kinase type II